MENVTVTVTLSKNIDPSLTVTLHLHELVGTTREKKKSYQQNDTELARIEVPIKFYCFCSFVQRPYLPSLFTLLQKWESIIVYMTPKIKNWARAG